MKVIESSKEKPGKVEVQVCVIDSRGHRIGKVQGVEASKHIRLYGTSVEEVFNICSQALRKAQEDFKENKTPEGNTL